MMKFKIGVMGSANTGLPKEIYFIAKEVGREIAKHNCILITGATTGVSHSAAEGLKEESGFAIGISPALNKEEHLNRYNMPLDQFDAVIYTGFGLQGRNVVNIRSSDAVIFINGSYGTLNEFTIAMEEGKVIGILEGSGGVADNIRQIINTCNKQTGSKVIFNKAPKLLVQQLIKELD